MPPSQGLRQDPRGIEGRLPGVSQGQRRPRAGGHKAGLKTAVAIGAISLVTVSIGVGSIRYISEKGEPQAARDPALGNGEGIGVDEDSAGSPARPSLAIHGTHNQGSAPARFPDVEERRGAAATARSPEQRSSTLRAHSQPTVAARMELPSLVSPVHGPAGRKLAADGAREGTEGRAVLHAPARASRSIAGRVQPQNGLAAPFPAYPRSAAASPSSPASASSMATSATGATLSPDAASGRSSAYEGARPATAGAGSFASEGALLPHAPGEAPDETVSLGNAPTSIFRPGELGDRADALPASDQASYAVPRGILELPAEQDAVGGVIRAQVLREGASGSRPTAAPAELASQVVPAPPVSAPLGTPAAEVGDSFAAELASDAQTSLPGTGPGRSSVLADRPGVGLAVDANAIARDAALASRQPGEVAPGTAASLSTARAGAGVGPGSGPPRAAAFPRTLSEDDWVLFSPRGQRGSGLTNREALPSATVSIGRGQAGETMDRLALRQMSDGVVAVRLEDLIKLLESEMERPLFVWLKSSASASKYVTFDTLRTAGIEVEYDASTNHLVLSASE